MGEARAGLAGRYNSPRRRRLASRKGPVVTSKTSISTGLLVTAALATLLAAVAAWPLLLTPARVVYGNQIVGRHPEVHAVIHDVAGAAEASRVPQPLTTGAARLLGRVVGPVTAFNLLMLATFPLTALATYAFARYLFDSHPAALVAALAFSFSPVRLAEMAYYPIAAQSYWVPLCLLALIALVDRLSVWRTLGLAIACAGAALGNAEAAWVVVLLSPVVLMAFWIVRPDAGHNLRPLVWPSVALLVVALGGAALIAAVRPDVLSPTSEVAVRIDDLGLYRAHWPSYLTPAVDHPWLGERAASLFSRRGINFELVEQQQFVGFSFLVLALGAIAWAAWTWNPQSRFLVALAVVGVAAAAVSTTPASGSCAPFSAAPTCLAHYVMPIFRAPARFGVVVDLVVVIAAGVGAVMLSRASSGGRLVASALLVIGAFEYWPLPARAHDVLPTQGHRWLSTEGASGRILDCYPTNAADRLVPWLMNRTISTLDRAIPSCGDPELGAKLAALGVTTVIVRGGQAASKLTVPPPPGISVAQTFPDSTIYSVSQTPPPIAIVASDGFFPYEHDGDDWWRWMGPGGRWTVRNTTHEPVRTTLSVNLVPFGLARRLAVTLDGAPVAQVSLGMRRSSHAFGPVTLTPGDHVLAFTADGEPTRPSDVAESRDSRPLSVAFRGIEWKTP